MNLPPLSREALQLLELLPAWQLRGVGSPPAGGAQTPVAKVSPVGEEAIALGSHLRGAEAMAPTGLAPIGLASRSLAPTVLRQGQGVALMIIIPRLGAATSPEARLWLQVLRALQGLGLPKTCLDQPLQLDRTDQQILTAQLNARDPRWLLVFGDELASMVALVEPGLAEATAPLSPTAADTEASPRAAGPAMFKTMGLAVLASEPQRKAQAWQDFCWLKQQLLLG